jgi:hypothetical protein
MANSLHFIQDQHLFLNKLLPLTDCSDCGVRAIKTESLGTLSGGLRKAPRTLQRIRSAAGREAGDAALKIWRHDLLSLCSTSLIRQLRIWLLPITPFRDNELSSTSPWKIPSHADTLARPCAHYNGPSLVGRTASPCTVSQSTASMKLGDGSHMA